MVTKRTKKPTKRTPKPTKRKREAAQKARGIDYQSLYEDLRRKVRKANDDKRNRLQEIIGAIKDVLSIVCEPDPPGCSGPVGTGSYEELAKACQESNSKKRSKLRAIAGDVDILFQKICDPDPPG